MLRSMYTAVSGLRAHQFKMDIIGNNIANVNTVGFKKSQVSFAESFSQSIRGASAPQGGKGGTNPQQVGLGVNVGSVRVIHDGSGSQRTDNPLDFFIDGSGFFVVSGDANFNNKLYTRAGNFELDRDGTLITTSGLKVLGFKANSDGTISDTISDIRINKSETVDPTATKNLGIKGNLDSRADIGETFTTDTYIYDSLGNPYTVTFEIKKTDSNEWDVEVKSVKDHNEREITGATLQSSQLQFDDNGKLTSDSRITLSGLPGTNGGTFENEINIDLSSLKQYGNDTTVEATKKDGNTSGVIESFTVSTTGEVVGVFSNGENKVIAQLAIAKFDNDGGLQKQGSNNFIDTRNSGEPQIGKAGSAGYGSIIGGSIEMSNVDLSYEFTEMITTQRGFQANSRVITTSDEILQELVNLKR